MRESCRRKYVAIDSDRKCLRDKKALAFQNERGGNVKWPPLDDKKMSSYFLLRIAKKWLRIKLLAKC